MQGLGFSESAFVAPENPEQEIWRYIKLPQFLDIIYNHRLFCATARTFDDKYEAALPELNVEYNTIKTLEKIQEAYPDILFTKQDVLWNSKNQAPRYRTLLRYGYGISCWHMNQGESAAMWSLYSRLDEGIAIRSTYRKLSALTEPGKTGIGAVKYIDYKTHVIQDADDRLSLLFYKRKSYEHEKELRLITKIEDNFNLLVTNGSELVGIEDKLKAGITLPFNEREIIDEVCISPTAPVWFKALIEKVLAEVKWEIMVTQSELTSDSLY